MAEEGPGLVVAGRDVSVLPCLLHALPTQATGWPVACTWPFTAAKGDAVTGVLSVPHRV